MHLGGELGPGIGISLYTIPRFLSLLTHLAPVQQPVNMTVATVLLQATSLISSLPQLHTNGKHSWLPF